MKRGEWSFVGILVLMCRLTVLEVLRFGMGWLFVILLIVYAEL